MTEVPRTDVLAWLRDERKLDDEMLVRMDVRAVRHPKLGDAVAFPYFRDDEDHAAACKFRTPAKKFASTAGQSRSLYNLRGLRYHTAQPVVVTEGEIDCLSVIQAGFERAVSVPDGWTETRDTDAALVEAEALLRQSPFVIVAGDADAAGRGLPRYVANLLKGHDVRHAVWPEGSKDANDVLVRHGEEALAACLSAAQRIDPPGGLITGFSDLPPLADRRVLRIGERPFDWAVALELGCLSVWTGIPGHGKSTFLIWAADRISRNESVRVGLFMFETHPLTLQDQLALMRMGQEFEALAPEWQAKLLADLDARFRLVHFRPEGDMQQTMVWLGGMIETLAIRDGCKLIVVDPWNELEHLPNPGETMTAYINWATKTLRQWAERLGVHIALVAHPRKMPTDGPPRAPNGYDIADSSAFFNKPSLGVTVHKREKADAGGGGQEKWLELRVWKVRDTRLYGFETGAVDVVFDPTTKVYRGRPRSAARDAA
jgi:twinkle protein